MHGRRAAFHRLQNLVAGHHGAAGRIADDDEDRRLRVAKVEEIQPVDDLARGRVGDQSVDRDAPVGDVQHAVFQRNVRMVPREIDHLLRLGLTLAQGDGLAEFRERVVELLLQYLALGLKSGRPDGFFQPGEREPGVGERGGPIDVDAGLVIGRGVEGGFRGAQGGLGVEPARPCRRPRGRSWTSAP